MKNRKTTAIILSMIVATHSSGQPEAWAANNLTESALYMRCYTQLTGKRPPLNQTLRKQVAAGTTTAIAACLTVLNKASFNTSGGNEGRMASGTDPEAIDVLNHMNDVHRSWFASDSLDNAIVDGQGSFVRDAELKDETEPALHITRALFQPGVPYSEVVTGSSGMEALRTGGAKTELTWNGTKGWKTDGDDRVPQKFRYSSISMGDLSLDGYSSTSTRNLSQVQAAGHTYDPLLNPELVQTGDMLGVRRISLNSGKMALTVKSTGGQAITAQQPYPSWYFNGDIKVHESLGGGYLGTKSYLSLNLGRPMFTFTDGGIDMPRRWAKAIFTETLCRDMPPIRSSDATVFVQGGSTLPFRNGRQCMECHASMDPLASAARNVTIRPTGSGSNETQSMSSQVAIHPVSEPAKPGMSDIDAKFYKRPPDGVLFFRSYSGDKVYIPLAGTTDPKSGIVALGQAIASTNDLYVCAASKYYQMMTGIKVSLQDIGDPAKPALSDTDLKFRNEVIALGLSLKNHQSLKQLMTDIMNSPTYKKVSPRSAN